MSRSAVLQKVSILCRPFCLKKIKTFWQKFYLSIHIFCLFHQQHCMLMMSRLMFNDIVTISSLSCWMLHSCAPRDGLTSLFAQSIKQHIKRCFWYLGDEEEQSCTLWSIFHKSAFYHKPSVYFRLPCFSVMWLQVCNSCAKYFSDFLSSRDHLRGRSHELFQSEYAFFHINALLVMEKTSATTYFVIVFVQKLTQISTPYWESQFLLSQITIGF